VLSTSNCVAQSSFSTCTSRLCKLRITAFEHYKILIS